MKNLENFKGLQREEVKDINGGFVAGGDCVAYAILYVAAAALGYNIGKDLF